jgi:hypothetical protein
MRLALFTGAYHHVQMEGLPMLGAARTARDRKRLMTAVDRAYRRCAEGIVGEAKSL